MTSDLTEAKPPPAASNVDAEALLDTANSGSQHVAVLHVAFMALCVYVLVIVFGTTDMDLLIGKGVKLPVVDVEVPIVGFYAFAPYLVVLVHFNLLLQLQLLSRQLYAFAAAAPEEKRIGGLRDRLHIFPFTYYLVGRPGRIVGWLLGIVVGITLLVLPLGTLLVLQLRFLAYQDEAVTWWQRVAVWFDVALVIALWPVIMDRRDRWRRYLDGIGKRLRRRWKMGLAWTAVWVALVAPGFITTKEGYFAALAALPGLLILLGIARALARLRRWWRGQRPEPEDAIPAAAPMVRGMPGLLLVVALGVPLPLGLLADGEWWEEEVPGRHVLLLQAADAGWLEEGEEREESALGRILLKYPVVASEVYYRFRRLDLSEQVLLGKPATPELIAQLREGDPEKVKEALNQVEPVKLRGRSLRGARFSYAFLPGADLRDVQLQGADLKLAQLQGVNLMGAQLPGADLFGAQLQGADLSLAQLQGARLWAALLQGARLWEAQLQGADLRGAQLQGANLGSLQLEDGDDWGRAQLQGADLRDAQLQGANLRGAQMQGANLRKAQLQAADLRNVGLYGATLDESDTALLDLRAGSWTPLAQAELARLRELLAEFIGVAGAREDTNEDKSEVIEQLPLPAAERIADPDVREAVLKHIERAGQVGVPPPLLKSCLIDPEVTPELKCQRQWLPAEIAAFQSELFPVLEGLACEYSWTARGLFHQTFMSETTDGRFGLAGRFAVLLDNPECDGLSSLPEADKDEIRDFAKREQERRGQSGTGKPAEEVPASPTPPPNGS